MTLPSRAQPTLKIQPRVLILCEDAKSCLDYLKDAARNFRAYAEVEIAHTGHTDPLGIVSVGIQRQRVFESVVCVIDRDTHENFNEAIRMADENSIKMIVSYPCYEFWLFLHFRYSRAGYVAAGKFSAGEVMARTLCNEPEMADYEKGKNTGIFRKLIDRLPLARKRSLQIHTEAVEDQGDMNPSTSMHQLMDFFEELQKPVPITK